MASPNIEADHVQTAQDNPEVPANAATDKLDNNFNREFNLDVAGGGTITLTTTQARENGRINFTGAPAGAFTVRYPDTRQKRTLFDNQTAQAATVENSTSNAANPVSVPASEARDVHYDGTDLVEAGGGSGGGTIDIQEGGSSVVAAATAVNFDTSNFDVTDEGGNVAGVALGQLTALGVSSDWEVLGRFSGSAVASIDSTFWAADLYDEIEVVPHDLVVATDGADVILRISTDGSTFDAGASDYDYHLWGNQANAGAEFEVEGDTSAFIQLTDNQGNAAGEAAGGRLHFTAADAVTNEPYITGQMGYVSATPTWVNSLVTGRRLTDSAVRGIQILASSGNISGSFTVRGRRLLAGDWVLLEDSVSPAAAVTHDFFWADDTYDEIETTATGIIIGTDAQNLDLRISSDGSTFHSGASDYEYAVVNHSDAGGSAFNNSSGADAEIVLVVSLGTAADEDFDVRINLQGVSNSSRKQKGDWEAKGRLSSATFFRFAGAFQDLNTNDRTRGIQLRGGGGATITWDRLRIRGRRK